MLVSLHRSLLAAAAICGMLVLNVNCGNTRSVRAAVKPEKDRKSAPEFSLKDAHGRVVKLSDYKEGGSAEFLGYLVRSMQDRDSVVHRFRAEIQGPGFRGARRFHG